jgi:hypothetical protein
MKIRLLALGLLLATSPVFAADIDGKIIGETLSFAQDVDFGGQLITFNYTGMLANGQLTLHTEFNGMPLDFALKKGT